MDLRCAGASACGDVRDRAIITVGDTVATREPLMSMRAFVLLLLALGLQVMADNALTFLIAWEAMSLSAYWLVSVSYTHLTLPTIYSV